MYINLFTISIITYFFLASLFAKQIRPVDGALLNSTHILFEWEQEPNATFYNFQLSNDIMFSNIINNVYDSTAIIILNRNLDRGNDYYWRVRPYFSDNSYGVWIDTLFFNINESLFDEINTEIIDIEKVEQGVIIFSTWHNPTRRTGIFDNDGNEIWNDIGNPFMMTNIDKYGQILGSRRINSWYEPIVYDLNNNLIWDGDEITMNVHDLIQLPNGNYMGFQPIYKKGDVPEGWENMYPLGSINWRGTRIIEWDRETKEELWDWNVFDYYDIKDYDSLGYSLVWSVNDSNYDWLHTNSIFFDKNEKAIYLSHRNISRITKISYPSGEIIWMMGLPSEYMSLILPAGNDEHICTDLLFSFQHHVTVLNNGNLLFFDNSRFSNLFFEIEEQISRVLEVSVIDNNYCEVIWEYDLPAELYSNIYGSVQLLNNGNYLINSKGGNGIILEITPDKDIVFQANMGINKHNYRVFRIPSIHPDALSILVDDFTEVQIGNYYKDGIILTEFNNILSIHINNESEYNHQFNYFLSDDSNWLKNSSDTLLIGANRDTTISFEVNFNEHPFSNTNFIYNYLPHALDSLNWTIYKGCDSAGNVVDCEGKCGGNMVEDCAGVCAGSAELDECGVCDGDNRTCIGCMNNTACNYDPEAVIDNVLCIFVDGICETCVDGKIVDNDADDDEICNASDQCSETVLDEIVDDNGCSSDQLSVFNGFIPEQYSIHNIYPNPFNSVTNIAYGLPVNVDIQFIVYNISGKHVHTLINKSQTPGYYSVNWNAENYPSGVYFVKMVAGNYINTQKLMLIK